MASVFSAEALSYQPLPVSSELSDASKSDGRKNARTGNLDYLRNVDMFNRTAAFNAEQAAVAREFNSREAAAQRAYNEYMSATAYQRAAADMRAAGLNPYLAITNGGAGYSSGASASSSPAAARGDASSVAGPAAQISAASISALANVASTAIKTKSSEAANLIGAIAKLFK